jgi:regulation of enolase protein 1 (concanavalin A-like superfamily)
MTTPSKILFFLFAALLTAAVTTRADDTPPFIHPGLLQSAADLARIKSNVQNRIEPWATAWKAFATNNRWLAPNYTPRPLAIVGRGVGATGQTQISNDCTAAYYNALAWTVTGNEAYAKKSIQIMDAWASTCTQINGKDAVLCAGIYGYKLMNAAEIIRATYPAWSPQEIAQFKHLARDIFYPVIQNFATFANGNWDAASQAAMISIAIFLDDRPMFDRAVRYYLAGSGDGALTHYILNDTGQLQETGRDQGHSQLGIGLLSCVAETAWHQGINLYSAADNRLLKGFEYTAKYNLGQDIPFTPTNDYTGKYNHTRPSVRGKPDMAIYEMVYNHYVNRMNLPAPFTAQAAALHRPEPLAIDQVGAGTLLFSLPPYHASPSSPLTAPGPLLATNADTAITLRWPASLGATSYSVQRASSHDGPYQTIASSLTALTYADTPPTRNHLYSYILFAANSLGRSAATSPVSACAGLPLPWQSHDIGNPSPPTHTDFDGTTFTLQVAGADIAKKSDQFSFLSLPLTGNFTLTARYLPPTPSQFAQLGLMLRESNTPDSPHVALLLTPATTKDAEAPHWHLELLTRTTPGADTTTLATTPDLDTPLVTWDRVMAPLWLRLTRTGPTVSASFSTDGHDWTSVASVTTTLSPTLHAGLAACSRIKNPTTIAFDHVSMARDKTGT